jgi:WD40 repeat protein
MWSSSAGHRHGAIAAVFAPDGRRLATSGDDGCLFIWAVGQGLEKELSDDDNSSVFCAAFSPDGMTLASGHDSFKCVLWDVATGQKRATLTGHTSAVMCLAFSPDGETLAAGGGEEEVRLWDVASGTLKAKLAGHRSGVNSVRFAPDGRILASACRCGPVTLWDVVDGSCRASLGPTTPGAWAMSLAFSPDGSTLASGGLCDGINLWDVETGLERKVSRTGLLSVRDVVFSADGQMVIAALLGGDVQLRNVFAGYTRTVHLAGFNTHCSVLSPDGRLLALVDGEGTVRVWDLRAVANRPLQTAAHALR